VLVISNDPDDLLNPANDSDAAAQERRQAQREQQLKKARASVNRSEPVTDIVTPVTTVANARNAHGILGVDQLRSSLRAALSLVESLDKLCGFAFRLRAGNGQSRGRTILVDKIHFAFPLLEKRRHLRRRRVDQLMSSSPTPFIAPQTEVQPNAQGQRARY
jgi:hypothetical protein